MSYLSENARYKVVLYDADKKKLAHPYYSLPAYDKKKIGKKMLIYKIIRGTEAENHKFAYIYDNITQQIIEVFINGIKQVKQTNAKKYGKNISMYKIWLVTKGKENLPITRYSHTDDDAKGNPLAYWQAVNKTVKSKEFRNIVEYAKIYEIKTNTLVGQYFRKNGILQGIGKFHKK